MKILLKSIYVHNINLKAFLNANIFIFFKIKSVIYEQKYDQEKVRNSFENEFLDIIHLFLIDEEIPEYTKKIRFLLKNILIVFQI